jgi:hypothetical protein
MSAEDRKTIATWLYENFMGKWGMDRESRSCTKNNENRNKE